MLEVKPWLVVPSFFHEMLVLRKLSQQLDTILATANNIMTKLNELNELNLRSIFTNHFSLLINKFILSEFIIAAGM